MRSLLLANRLDEAKPLLMRIAAEQPENPDVLQLLGMLARKRKKPQRAVALLAQALALRPGSAKLHASHARALRDAGRLDDAIVAYRRALAIDPELVAAHRELAHVFLRKRRADEAGRALEETIKRSPDDARSHHFLGNVYRHQNRPADAVASYRRALSLDPDLAMARFGECVAQLPIVYDSEEEIDQHRAAYERCLCELRDFFAGKPSPELARAASAAGTVRPFYLAYQGRDDLDLQRLYGGIVCRLMAAGFPQWGEPLFMPAPEADGRIRVGILSGYFRWHSNWKIPIRGWAEQLDRKKLRLFGYYTQNSQDENTRQAARHFERFVIGPKSIAAWAETIRGDELHALIVPEIGMDEATARLAALRLAPVQCGSWGHPETSGYPTMDYFLSSDLMEPADGEEHYSERLVRLPNLSLYYIPPRLPEDQVSRAELGLRPDSVAYWCCQSLFKYRPRDDSLFPRIAAELGNAQFLFIRHKSDFVTRAFQARLRRAFTRFGLEAERHCVFVDRLPPPRFAAAMRQCDLFLDSLGWSGCNSALEAMSVGLPVITCPGELMRGRHSAAILSMVGLEQAIAPTPEAYAELAVALGRDRERRTELGQLVRERQSLAHGDLQAVRGLEDFLCKVSGVS